MNLLEWQAYHAKHGAVRNLKVVGIHVGGPEKGFQLAVMTQPSSEIDGLHSVLDITAVTQIIESFQEPVLVALGCPRNFSGLLQSPIVGSRSKHWTGMPPPPSRELVNRLPDWADNAEMVWRAVEALRFAETIETFPMVTVKFLTGSPVSIPLRLLPESWDLEKYGGYVDAAISAEIGSRYLLGKAERAFDGWR